MDFDYEPPKADPKFLDANPDLALLMESIAERIHDAWAAERFSQGWTYGPNLDDKLKKHPSLVPYRMLPEEEKRLDRTTAATCIDALIAEGYNLTRANRA